MAGMESFSGCQAFFVIGMGDGETCEGCAKVGDENNGGLESDVMAVMESTTNCLFLLWKPDLKAYVQQNIVAVMESITHCLPLINGMGEEPGGKLYEKCAKAVSHVVNDENNSQLESNKMAVMESITNCPSLITRMGDGKLYFLFELGQKALSQMIGDTSNRIILRNKAVEMKSKISGAGLEAVTGVMQSNKAVEMESIVGEDGFKAVSGVIDDKNYSKIQSQQNKMEVVDLVVIESKTLQLRVERNKMAFANRFAHGFFCEHGPKAILGIIGDENNSKLLFHQNKVVSWLKHGLFHQNKVAKLESKTDCPALIYFEVEGGKLYCLCKPGLKTMCQDCAKAVSCVIGDKNKFQLYKIVVMEDGNSHSLSKECIKAVLHLVGDALSHHKQKDENNLMCSKLQFISQQNKTVESVPDWSGLLTDVLIDIALKLSLFEDLAAFRGVCTSWRAAGAMVKSVFKVPLLMLQEKEGDGDVRELYSLSKKKIVSRISMPEARGKRCLDVGFGWILTVATSGGELNMVKPMISSKIQLPNMKTFPEYKKYSTEPEVEFVTAAMLSEDPLETSDYMLMVCVNMNLGFWRNGDNHWSKLEAKVLIPTSLMNCFANIGYHKHKMYAFDFGMRVWMWDPYGTQAPRVILTLELKLDQVMHLPYFVESSKGELLLLFRDSVHQSGREEDEMVFWIMKIDTVNNEYKEIDTLGGDAVFVGQNKAVAVVADDFPGVIKANCIYFTDNDFEQYRSCRGIAEMGIYSVEDYNTERFGVESNSEICPAFWAFPSL